MNVCLCQCIVSLIIVAGGAGCILGILFQNGILLIVSPVLLMGGVCCIAQPIPKNTYPYVLPYRAPIHIL